MKRALSELSDLITSTTVPVKFQKSDQPNRPHIVNVVSTVCILPQSATETLYSLPLEEINMKLGCTQFAPRVFAAGIIKFTDVITDITILVFRSGKMVIVSCKTIDHARLWAQFIRILIEQVAGLKLTGRTVFSNFRIHNIVGHSHLGCKIDLQAMCDAAPACCKWDPSMFPGLKCKIWLTHDYKCGCDRRGGSGSARPTSTLTKFIGKESKCVCVVKVLVFDEGGIVITGSKTIDNVNSVFYRINQLAPQFETGKNDAVIPREDRFYHRLSRMMVPSGNTGKVVKEVVKKEVKQDDAMALILAGMASNRKASSVSNASGAGVADTTPLMRMAESNQLDNVLMTLAMDPGQKNDVDSNGLTALERMKRIPMSARGSHYRAILDALEKM